MGFEPSLVHGSTTTMSPFRFWCQKVLPLVYDNSLSYYELLCKVVEYLNETMENVNAIGENTNALYQSYLELVEYVNTYFDNLDVQEEINNKLDAMAESGELGNLIEKYLPNFLAFVTPQMYGAIADGVADDTGAFNKMIEETSNGALIIIPTGVYNIPNFMTQEKRTYIINRATTNETIQNAPYASTWYQLGVNSEIFNITENGTFAYGGNEWFKDRLAGTLPYSQILGVSDIGNMGVTGASKVRNTDDESYALGICGYAEADNPNNNSSIGGGYFHLIRKSSCNGNSIGIEIDMSNEVESPVYFPDDIPGSKGNFSTSIMVSNGGGSHETENARAIVAGICINKNLQKFQHGIMVTKGSAVYDAIALPNDYTGSIAWYNNDVPVASICGFDASLYGLFRIRLWNPSINSYVEKDFDINSNFVSSSLTPPSNPYNGQTYCDGVDLFYWNGSVWVKLAKA